MGKAYSAVGTERQFMSSCFLNLLSSPIFCDQHPPVNQNSLTTYYKSLWFSFKKTHTFTNEDNKNINCINEIHVSGQCDTLTSEGCSVSCPTCDESSQTFENISHAMLLLIVL